MQRRSILAIITLLLRAMMLFVASVDYIDFSPPEHRDKGFIIVANHRSILDLAVGLIVFKRWNISPYIFIREDYFRNPIAGWLLRALGGIPAGRENGVDAMRQGIRILRDSGILVVMPEGRILRNSGSDNPWGKLKPGVARLASAAGSPLLVGRLSNTDLAWPPGSAFPRFHFRRSRCPRISISVTWLPVTKGAPNSQIISAIDAGMRSIISDLGLAEGC